MTSRTIESLQAVRAIAAIFVLLYHVSGTFQAQFSYPLGFNVFSFGIAGVDIFFVLSGFIIYYTSSNNINLTTKEFLLKRFIRIFPIYWVLFAVTLGLIFCQKLFFSAAASISNTTRIIENGGLTSLLKSFFLIPNDFRTIYLSWTLSFEIVFYLLFGLFFFRNSRLFMTILTIWVGLCYANAFLIHIDFLNHLAHNPFKAFLNPIVAEFFLGCLVAILILKYPPKYPVIAFFIGMVFFLFSALKVTYSFSIADEIVFFFGVPSAFIIYGIANIKSSVPKFLTYLGDASYSIYLFHEPFFALLIKAIALFKLTSHIKNFLGMGFISVVLILLCCLVHNYIEIPLLRFCRKKIAIPQRNNLHVRSANPSPATNL